MASRAAAAAFILVAASYFLLGGFGLTDRGDLPISQSAYNLLARALLSGRLDLPKEVPPGLARLADPYDPAANIAFREDPGYRLQDLSYRGGRLYLYFGIAPALLLFAPWHLLTGGWLQHWVAGVLLCAGGLALTCSLVAAVRTRCLPRASPWILPGLVLILGLASFGPLLAARADFWELPTACEYLAVAAALRLLWNAIDDPGRSLGWLAAASAAYGVAFASRPTALPAAAALGVVLLDRRHRGSARAWIAAAAPLGVCAAAVGAYNAARFAGPLDFGMRYQLSGSYIARAQAFSPSYLWTNTRLYLFQGVDWSGIFPWAHEPDIGALPPGHEGVDHICGALLNAPVLWAGLLLPFALPAGPDGRRLRVLLAVLAWTAAVPLCLYLGYYYACSRYQFEFTWVLALLAALGICALEARLEGPARIFFRTGWILALVVSGAFTVLYGIDRCAKDHADYGVFRLLRGEPLKAQRELAVALLLSPRNPTPRLASAIILENERRVPEARTVLESLVRDFPRLAPAQVHLGNILRAEGDRAAAAVHYQAALAADPSNRAAAAGLSALKTAGP